MAADYSRLGDDVRAMDRAGADLFHWDIMDGHFVPNITFGVDAVKHCRSLSDKEFDVHLMVLNPVAWTEHFIKAGADNITVHVESKDYRTAIHAIKAADKKAGLALRPNTSLEDVPDDLWAELDRILIMTVQPGFGGQTFIDQSEKIRKAAQKRTRYPKLDIMVDGGINPDTAPTVIAAGATTLVSGSALFKNGAGQFHNNLQNLRGAA